MGIVGRLWRGGEAERLVRVESESGRWLVVARQIWGRRVMTRLTLARQATARMERRS